MPGGNAIRIRCISFLLSTRLTDEERLTPVRRPETISHPHFHRIETAMKSAAVGLIILGFCASASSDETPKKTKPKFTISKETTFITEPLDKDGYPDYAAALNARLSKGVTPENNGQEHSRMETI
jgi:hypothetical protein